MLGKELILQDQMVRGERGAGLLLAEEPIANYLQPIISNKGNANK